MYTRLFCRSLYVHFGLFINEEDVRFRIKRLLSVSLRTFWPLNADTDIRGQNVRTETDKSLFMRTRTSVVVAGVRMTQVSRKRPVKETYVYIKRP